MNRVLIKGGILYTMVKDQEIFEGDILVEDGKIKETGKNIQAEDAQVIEPYRTF